MYPKDRWLVFTLAIKGDIAGLQIMNTQLQVKKEILFGDHRVAVRDLLSNYNIALPYPFGTHTLTDGKKMVPGKWHRLPDLGLVHMYMMLHHTPGINGPKPPNIKHA